MVDTEMGNAGEIARARMRDRKPRDSRWTLSNLGERDVDWLSRGFLSRMRARAIVRVSRLDIDYQRFPASRGALRLDIKDWHLIAREEI